MNEIGNIRRCKKCGAELPADLKGNKCQYCKAKGTENAKKIGGGILGVLAAAGTVVMAVLSNNKNNSNRT